MEAVGFDRQCTSDVLSSDERANITTWIVDTHGADPNDFCFSPEHLDVIYSSCFCVRTRVRPFFFFFFAL